MDLPKAAERLLFFSLFLVISPLSFLSTFQWKRAFLVMLSYGWVLTGNWFFLTIELCCYLPNTWSNLNSTLGSEGRIFMVLDGCRPLLPVTFPVLSKSSALLNTENLPALRHYATELVASSLSPLPPGNNYGSNKYGPCSWLV